MQVKRDMFLKRLIARRRNGMVKVITGLRRCGKSYLLGVLYKDYLLADGVRQDHIIEVALDEPSNCKYHNPLKLEKHLKRQIKDNGGTGKASVHEAWRFIPKDHNRQGQDAATDR